MKIRVKNILSIFINKNITKTNTFLIFQILNFKTT